MKIGITLTSSLSVGQEYIDLTHNVAEMLARNGFGVVYGGTEYGMMAELAQSYKNAGGNELIGIMSEELKSVTKGYKAFENLDNAIWTNQMGERIRKIIDTSDGYIILPGGYGTLEELMSILGGKANKIYDKPIVLLNHNHYYDKLVAFLDEMQNKEFSKIAIRELAHICETPEDIINYFNTYSQSTLPDKFV
ncbi:MAG: TIGR00730 family Rossman fold protein [Bacteroides sp.]|nr:TIGR00730 family Rossman fold protein [Candidatus Paceibacterota bacterium]MBP9721175.1 TIGR00730 family Rossman fold protein [Bacteroides sp.]